MNNYIKNGKNMANKEVKFSKQYVLGNMPLDVENEFNYLKENSK